MEDGVFHVWRMDHSKQKKSVEIFTPKDFNALFIDRNHRSVTMELYVFQNLYTESSKFVMKRFYNSCKEKL